MPMQWPEAVREGKLYRNTLVNLFYVCVIFLMGLNMVISPPRFLDAGTGLSFKIQVFHLDCGYMWVTGWITNFANHWENMKQS